MLRGYARAQLVDRIGDIIPHLKPEEELDDDLLRHLAKVVDRRKLMDVLEENRSHKETIALEKAAQEAEDERSRWRDELTDGEAATITSGLSPVQLDMIAAAQTKELPATQPGSSVVPPKLTPVPEQPTESPPMHRRPSGLPRANLRDPEVQYRKLQEQLGLVESTESAVNDRVEPESVEPSSAGLAFKSIISKNSVRAINSGKPATTRKRVRFNLVKPGRRG